MLTPQTCMLQVWDPQLIIAQIITVQCLFYISLGLIQAVTIGEPKVPSTAPRLGHGLNPVLLKGQQPKQVSVPAHVLHTSTSQ